MYRSLPTNAKHAYPSNSVSYLFFLACLLMVILMGTLIGTSPQIEHFHPLESNLHFPARLHRSQVCTILLKLPDLAYLVHRCFPRRHLRLLFCRDIRDTAPITPYAHRSSLKYIPVPIMTYHGTF